jgi:TonB family protein
MNPRRSFAVLLLVPLLAARLGAQQVLMAEDNGKLSWVRGAQGIEPCVEKDGNLVQISTKGFVLKPVTDYLPAFITVRDVFARDSYMMTTDRGSTSNTFLFNATLETGYALKNVFLVLELVPETSEKTIFLMEVGDLEPFHDKAITVTAPMTHRLGSGIYHLHLFSHGEEVLQSQIPAGEREAALDKMVAERIEGIHAASPKLLFGPAPGYPASLKSANIGGQAVISLRIGTNGAVYNPVVKSATNPAFGEEALAAIRAWRFLPTVRNEAPVETEALIPFKFQPPRPNKDQS